MHARTLAHSRKYSLARSHLQMNMHTLEFNNLQSVFLRVRTYAQYILCIVVNIKLEQGFGAERSVKICFPKRELRSRFLKFYF